MDQTRFKCKKNPKCSTGEWSFSSCPYTFLLALLVAKESADVVFPYKYNWPSSCPLYLTLSCSMSNETRKGVEDYSISIHHEHDESCIMLEQVFPNFVK